VTCCIVGAACNLFGFVCRCSGVRFVHWGVAAVVVTDVHIAMCRHDLCKD